MSHSKSRQIGLVLTVLTVLALPAAAWDGVEVTASSGLLRQQAYFAPSPTPAYCYWERDAAADPVFRTVNTDGEGNNECGYAWVVHCDGDSLVYRGSWPTIDWAYVLGSSYYVELTCVVEVAQTTRLVASRSVNGVLTTDVHTLTLGLPDGSTQDLLVEGSGPDRIELELQPGTHQVTLLAYALQSVPITTAVDPYLGSIRLDWQDPTAVAVETRSWSSVKATYR